VDIRLLEGAKEDLRNGWFFYERQTTGLGDRFLNAIEADVRLLPAYAGIHLQVDGFHRILISGCSGIQTPSFRTAFPEHPHTP
jgi:hypothetical protein